MYRPIPHAIAAVILLSLSACEKPPQQHPPSPGTPGEGGKVLSLVATVPLPGVEGRFDHFAADVKGNRLFVAALGNNTVEVIDLATNTRAGSIEGLRKPTGIAFIPRPKRGVVAVAAGDDGTCAFFEEGARNPAGIIRDLDDADNVRYDAAADRLYVGYGGGALAVIDPAAMKRVGDIRLDAHPESFRLEEKGARIFVNLPDAGAAVAVVDRTKGAVVATWKLKDAAANFPMWLDEPNRRLFVGCRKPAKVVVLDTDTGRTVTSVDCVGDTDDLFFDAKAHRLYVTGGEGAITVIEQLDADHYRRAGTVPTAPGARTSLFVPELSRLYLAVPHRGKQPAEIRVYATP